jgi:hypothetical protein
VKGGRPKSACTLELKLEAKEEKADLVAFLRQL